MATTFREALKIAKAKYPHRINRYEEYEKYFIFSCDDGGEHVGGEYSPIVIRKSDAAALNYTSVFFGLWPDAEDIGEPIAEGAL